MLPVIEIFDKSGKSVFLGPIIREYAIFENGEEKPFIYPSERSFGEEFKAEKGERLDGKLIKGIEIRHLAFITENDEYTITYLKDKQIDLIKILRDSGCSIKIMGYI